MTMTRTQDQVRHDAINLTKIVKRLETSVDEEDWNTRTPGSRQKQWLKAQNVLYGIQYSRSLLQNVTAHDGGSGVLQEGSSETIFWATLCEKLDRMDKFISKVNEESKPQPRPLKPILSTLPLPQSRKPEVTSIPSDHGINDAAKNAVEESRSNRSRSQDLLLDSSDTILSEEAYRPMASSNPSATLLPPSIPSTSETPSKVSAQPAFLDASHALQTGLSDQLLLMAQQLKRNAQHFSGSLAKDQGVLQETGEKIEENFGTMQKERVRLRDHSGKSRGTTWLVMLSIVVVFASFFLMFFVIRLT
ncbi:hypothetical protein BD410DRAFT_895417 [Rickenella mellea]|uniref:t-SNARE coiled-coil homology domain-containing protein n=1 Tax=Rickenella mellea TaxID=50990 RepID=A0A4Y7QE30_9AGAM|nr:hypothetical protein BD410DRAFT_895417 [Rickenella mellea]